MNSTNSIKTRMAVTGLALGLLCGTAVAGSKFTGNGSVVATRLSTGYTVTGYLGHIYNGSGKTEFMRCTVGYWPYPDEAYVACWARVEGDSTVYGCSVRSNYLAKSVISMSGDSKVTIRYGDDHVCTSITVVQSSEYQDKK
jgi:hypothetical protein